MAIGGLISMILLTLAEMANLLAPQHLPASLKERFFIFLLWASHAMVFLALFLFLEAAGMKKAIPSAILLFEGMTFLYRYRHKETAHWMFGTWGMYAQSYLYDPLYGFSILCIMAIQMICIAVCYQAGRWFLKRDGAPKNRNPE